MELAEIIQFLHKEKRHVEKLIAAFEELEILRNSDGEVRGRRGRKSMNAEERRLVSERMAKYWADRKAKQAEAVEKPEEQLLEEMRIAQKAYNETAAEHGKLRAEFANMLDNPDTVSGLKRAATNERVAAQKYKAAVKAYRKSMRPD